LRRVGFALRRETDRFRWRGEGPHAASGGFSFRALEEVGEDAFVDAMRRVSEGTLDREIRGERMGLGPQGAARDYFEDARRVKHEPLWWRLAYDGRSGYRGRRDADGAARLPYPLLRRRGAGD
jgi:hypothetical protein